MDWQGSKDRSRLGAVAIIGCSIALILLPFIFYFFVWQEKERAEETERKMRAVDQMAQEFRATVDALDQVIDLHVQGAQNDGKELTRLLRQQINNKAEKTDRDLRKIDQDLAQTQAQIKAYEGVRDDYKRRFAEQNDTAGQTWSDLQEKERDVQNEIDRLYKLLIRPRVFSKIAET